MEQIFLITLYNLIVTKLKQNHIVEDQFFDGSPLKIGLGAGEGGNPKLV